MTYTDSNKDYLEEELKEHYQQRFSCSSLPGINVRLKARHEALSLMVVVTLMVLMLTVLSVIPTLIGTLITGLIAAIFFLSKSITHNVTYYNLKLEEDVIITKKKLREF